jgi:uncharacterized protein
MLDNIYISQISNFFTDKPVKRSYLFGSFVRNQESDISDIDILVEIDYRKQKVSLLDFIGWKLELEKITGRSVDLVATDGISKYIKPIINKEKILLYERSAKR